MYLVVNPVWFFNLLTELCSALISIEISMLLFKVMWFSFALTGLFSFFLSLDFFWTDRWFLTMLFSLYWFRRYKTLNSYFCSYPIITACTPYLSKSNVNTLPFSSQMHGFWNTSASFACFPNDLLLLSCNLKNTHVHNHYYLFLRKKWTQCS